MGNKITFVFLFFIFLVNASLSWGEDKSVAGNQGTILIKGAVNNITIAQIPQFCDQRYSYEIQDGDTMEIRCQCRYGRPNEALKSYPRDEASKYEDFCPKTATASSVSCDPNSHDEPDEHGNIYCRCNNPDANGSFGVYMPDRKGGSPDVCPSATTSTASTEVIECIKSIEKEIEDCSQSATKAGDTCSEKGEKNASINKTVSGASSMIGAALQKGGSAESCNKAGLLSSTAGYGAGMMATDCKKDFDSCQSACSEEKILIYGDAEEIKNFCVRNGGSTYLANPQNLEKFNQKANELSALVRTAENTCASTNKPTKAQTFLNNSIQTAKNFAGYSAQAAACEAAIAGKSSLVPLTLDCALGTGTNCPVNCVTNPGDKSCNAVSGTASQLAAIAAKTTPTSALSFNGKGAGGNTSVGLGDLDLNDGSAKPLAEMPKDPESGSVFSSAGPAQAGGGGSTSPAGGNDKADSGGEGTEEKGILGGAFAAVKSGANRLANSIFGNRSSTSSSESKNTKSTSANSSVIRGLAHANGSTCYVDAKGAEFCFGPKNKDIFKIMNMQYLNQARKNSFVP